MIVFLLRMLARVLARLPLPAALRVGRAGGTCLGSVIRFRRAEVERELARCFPERTPAERRGIAARVYRNLGMNVVEVLRLSVLGLDDLRDRVTVTGEVYFDQMATGEAGSLVLMAHFGNWEAMGIVPDLMKRRSAVVVKPIRNRGIQAYLEETRCRRLNMQVLYARRAYRDCLRAIREGTLVAMVLDQNTLRDRGVFVDYFGRPACTTPGLALLAARTRRPVFPIFDVRNDEGRHEIVMLPPIAPPPDHGKETLRAFTQQYTRVIEDMVRLHPEQWMWLHRRWRTQPKESGAAAHESVTANSIEEARAPMQSET